MAFFLPKRVKVDSVQRYDVVSKLRNPQIWNDVTRFWQTFTTPILKSLARTFCITATKYSPPGRPGKQLGTLKISQMYYYTDIIDMAEVLKNPNSPAKLKKFYAVMMAKGFKYTIIYTKYRKRRRPLGYAKTYAEAMQIARIKNRGLAKYSWGSLLNNFSGAEVKRSKEFNTHNLDWRVGLYETELQATYKNLAAKSPSIAKYRWGTIRISADDMSNSKWSMDVNNNLTQSEQYCRIAVQKGQEAVLKQWRAIGQAINNRSISTLQDFLDFQINKINIKCNNKSKRRRWI